MDKAVEKKRESSGSMFSMALFGVYGHLVA